jgi:hypothetical protein
MAFFNIAFVTAKQKGYTLYVLKQFSAFLCPADLRFHFGFELDFYRKETFLPPAGSCDVLAAAAALVAVFISIFSIVFCELPGSR